MRSRRLVYALLALLTITVGLSIHFRGSRFGATAQDIIGDVLYAMMVAWWIGALAPSVALATRSMIAYAICAAIEGSQLWHAPIADAMRDTTLGKLILGSGFDARDLAAYAIGVLVAAFLEFWWNRRQR